MNRNRRPVNIPPGERVDRASKRGTYWLHRIS